MRSGEVKLRLVVGVGDDWKQGTGERDLLGCRVEVSSRGGFALSASQAVA